MSAHEHYTKAVNIYNAGKFKESIPEFIKAIETAGLDQDETYCAFVYLGSACIGIDDYNSAIINLKKALSFKRNDFWVYYEFGRVHYFGIVDYQQALSYFNQAIQYNTTHALSWDMKGLCEQHLGRYTEANESLLRALKYAKISNKKVVPIIETEIKVLDSLIKTKPARKPVQNISDTIKRHYQKGKTFFTNKNFNEALSEFNLALKETITDKKLYYSLLLFKGQCLKELMKYNLALQVFDTAISCQPKMYNAYYEEGVLFFTTHNFTEAISCFQKAKTCNPSNIDVVVNLALSQLAAGDYDNAKINLNQAQVIAKSTNNEKYDDILWMNKHFDSLIGFSLVEHNHTDDAVSFFDKTLENNATDCFANWGKGLCLFAGRKYDDAISYLKKKSERIPPAIKSTLIAGKLTAIVSSYIGAAYFKLNHYESALQYLDRGINGGNTTNANFWGYKGECHLQLNQYDEAIKAFTSGIEYLSDGDEYSVTIIEEKISAAKHKLSAEKLKSQVSQITIQGNHNPINFGGILATDDALINRPSINTADASITATATVTGIHFCPECGTNVNPEDKFCKVCGKRLL